MSMSTIQNCAFIYKKMWIVFLTVYASLLNAESIDNVTTQYQTNDTCDNLFKNGVQAYLEERWADCIIFLEQAIQTYNNYMRNLITCRIKCKQEAQDSNPIIHTGNIEDLHVYENIIRNTLCQIKCKKNNKYLSNDYTINKNTEIIFETRKPYEYLHICYFQEGKIQDAASAAFTYLADNPGNKIMLKNFGHYATLSEVNMNNVLNFEAKDYVYLYTHGSNMYNDGNWKSVINYMEESLTSYLQSEEECRAQCEGPFDQGWHPDFISSVANHFTYCLKCKRQCPNKLNTINGEQHNDLLPSHFHYLQFAYFKVGNLKMACEAVASYLLFYPHDEIMTSNKEYYSKLPKIKDEYFTARQEIIEYVKRQKNEIKVIHYINTQFVFNETNNGKEEANEISKDI